MNLNRIKELPNKITRACDACHKNKMKAPFYILKPHPAIKKLFEWKEQIVCHLCAMKEEFGGGYKQNKKYKEWIDAK